MTYRDIPRISNSDLTAFKHTLFGMDYKVPQKAFAFGNALHELILEPHLSHSLPKEVDPELVQLLAGKVRQDRFCKWYLQFSRKEKVQLWECQNTGLLLKSKLDVVYKGATIIDFKSTSAKSYHQFVESFQRYDYDRQAAFYLDSIQGKRFIFIGVQKKSPYGLFYFEADSPFIRQGRKKYQALLRKWKEVQAINCIEYNKTGCSKYSDGNMPVVQVMPYSTSSL